MDPADEMARLSLNTAPQLLGQCRQHDSVGVGADHHDALFPERCEVGLGEAFGGPRCVFLQPGPDGSLARRLSAPSGWNTG